MAKKKNRKRSAVRKHVVQIRLNATEKEHVQRCADIRNLTVSEYARLALTMGRLT